MILYFDTFYTKVYKHDDIAEQIRKFESGEEKYDMNRDAKGEYAIWPKWPSTEKGFTSAIYEFYRKIEMPDDVGEMFVGEFNSGRKKHLDIIDKYKDKIVSEN